MVTGSKNQYLVVLEELDRCSPSPHGTRDCLRVELAPSVMALSSTTIFRLFNMLVVDTLHDRLLDNNK